ncbi:PREDICTED: acyltransferase-like protein At1g54570, chloroplastic [Tarenaya hassleriana]|uniref:acyltransferase-like protein At1g54570, chloroplastic n=1 Tax=Tarenaya hassleriana TaxID=28532 RepID=UPI00053C9875|nr:PREDICTED: acyltransferase-like protein At1g54570, chloroplastic [Tarenaya hassleriana]
MATCSSLSVLSKFRSNSGHKLSFRVRAQVSGDERKTAVGFPGSMEPVNGSISLGRDKHQVGSDGLADEVNGKVKFEKKTAKDEAFSEMELLWDDGYGSKTVKDYFLAAKKIITSDGGPPRWFIPEDCDRPIKDAPTLMFLPGLDGTGLGLILHHKALGKAFHLRCLHIPVNDRTPFDGLVKLVEDALRREHASSPDKPIYLLGDSFGGCLALAVAARNPHIDIVLILVNPATSFERSQLQPLLPILELLPEELHFTVPYALSFVMGDPLKMASVDINTELPTGIRLQLLREKLSSLLPFLSVLGEIVPKETLLWKLKLLRTGAAYANSRLHAVKAEVLVLASGKDNMLPSQEEAMRLHGLFKNCTVRVFKDNGHTLLLEDSVSLLTVIKGTCKYRRSRRVDYVSDFLLPSKGEFEYATNRIVGFLRYAVGSVMFSTMEDGRIVKGLAGVPDEGPVLLVGYHMLMGLELGPMSGAFVREKRILFRGMAHPVLYSENESSKDFGYVDWFKVFGAYPVTPSNLYKLLASKSHVLLYPGGAREALHYRGEEYKLIWPEHQEFVRMAARFGATIVPFGTVGEDDIAELVLDYNDLMKIPFINNYVSEAARDASRFRLRDESSGEVANQRLYLPGLLPKIPGRFYYLFGKPIHTKGREDLVKDKEAANNLYLHVKAEVERSISYLLKKREEDPYRSIIDRVAYSVAHTPAVDVPSFEP